MTKKTRYFMAGSAAILVAGLGTGLVAYYGGGFPSLSASRSGPAELSYVPADASLVAYANVREVMDSQLRQRLKERHAATSRARGIPGATGIDIERDIDYVVAADHARLTPSRSERPRRRPRPLQPHPARDPRPRARRRGRRIQGQAPGQGVRRRPRVREADPDPADPSEPQRHRNHHPMALAFLEPGLVAIGSETAIKSSIDAQLTAHSITSNNEMMELVSDIERGNNAWAVGRFDAIANQARLPEQIRSQIPAVKTFAVMSHIDGGVTGTLRAEARDDQSAENLRQVVQGFLALGRLSRRRTPRSPRCCSRCSSPAPARPSRSRSRFPQKSST